MAAIKIAGTKPYKAPKLNISGTKPHPLTHLHHELENMQKKGSVTIGDILTFLHKLLPKRKNA